MNPKEQPSQIASEIGSMFRKDQQTWAKIKTEEDYVKAQELYRKNAERMKQIVEQIGYPSYSTVGQEASQQAFFIVQHADYDSDFQKHCLALMKSLPEGDINPINIAYLEDRVRVNTGKPQLYGTQFYTDELGIYGPKPIENLIDLERRRYDIGMEPFSKYRESMLKKHPKMKRVLK